MKKKLLLRLCLMMSVALFIYACRTDHLPENETAYNNSSKFQLTSKRISLNESKHKEKLIPELDKAETAFKNSKTNVNGKVIDYGNGVSIDTDDVIYIENGPNYHTYTFYIKRENALPNDPLENLVLTPLTDGTYRELLFSYHLTPQEKQIFMNGGFVNIKNKITVTDLEKGTFNSGGELAKSQSQNCTLEYEYYYTTCSANKHNQGEKCEAERFSELVFVIREVCVPSPGGSDGPYLPVDPNFPGGGGGGDSDGSSSTPCDGNGVPTGPQAPASGLGYDSGDGCGNGIPTQPNIPNPGTADPCEKTKALLEDPVLTAKVETLKENSKIKKGQPGYGESAVEINNDGTTSAIIPGGDHEVKLESSAGKKGAYHNHTPEGIKMFSPADILSMLTYSLTQPIGNLNNGFLGMVGTEKCGTCPDGYKYHNYIIRFSGNSQELEKYLFQTNWDKNALDEYYEDRVYELRDNPLYVNEYGRLNNNGLQKLFFDTLKNMEMEGKVTLQKIEDNGSVQNIVLDNAGNPSPIPCP